MSRFAVCQRVLTRMRMIERVSFADDPATTTHYSAADGEQLELDCSARREQDSDVVTWYKDGHVISEDFSHMMTMNGAVLTVRDVRPSDRGRYECRITDRPTGQLIRRHTFIVTEGGTGTLCRFSYTMIEFLVKTFRGKTAENVS